MSSCNKNRADLLLPNLSLFWHRIASYKMGSKFIATIVFHMLKIQINSGLDSILQGLISKGCSNLQVQDSIHPSDWQHLRFSNRQTQNPKPISSSLSRRKSSTSSGWCNTMIPSQARQQNEPQKIISVACKQLSWRQKTWMPKLSEANSKKNMELKSTRLIPVWCKELSTIKPSAHTSFQKNIS